MGMWNFDGSIPQEHLQQYSDLACTLVSKLYACEDWKDRHTLENREALFRQEDNIVLGNELPPVLRLLCGFRRDQATTPLPWRSYARTSLQMQVQIVANHGPRRRPEVLHTVADHSEVSRVAVEHVREGNSEVIHSIRSRAARVVATDEHVRVQMLAIESQFPSMFLGE